MFWATYWRIPPCTHQQPTIVVWRRSIFPSLPMSLLPNWTTTTMCSFVIWSIETKFNLATPTIGVFANSNSMVCHHDTSLPHYKRTGLHLTSTMWVSKKVPSKMRCTSSISHNVKSLQFPMSHIIRSHATPPHFFLCGSSSLNRISIGLPALRAGKPQLPCELWAHESALPLCQPMRHL